MANSPKTQGQDYWLLNSDNLANASNRKYILFKGDLFYNFLAFNDGVFQSQENITTSSNFRKTMMSEYKTVEQQYYSIAGKNQKTKEEEKEAKEKKKLMETLYASRRSFAHGCEMCEDYPDKCYMLVCYVETETDGTGKVYYAPAIAISITYVSYNPIQYQIGISRLDVPPLQPSRLLPPGFSETFFKKACWAIRDAGIGDPRFVVVNPNATMIPRIEAMGGNMYLKKAIPDDVKEWLIILYANDKAIKYAKEEGLSINNKFNMFVPLVTIANEKLFVIPIDDVENPSVNEDDVGKKKEGGRKKRMKRKTKRKRKRKLRRKKKSHSRRKGRKGRNRRKTRRKKLCITKKH